MVVPLIITSLFSLTGLNPATPQVGIHKETILASEQFSLEDRYANKYVSDVFKENILLNMAYMRDTVKDPAGALDWNSVNTVFHYEFSLDPGKTFAYQDVVFDKYAGKVEKTTEAHFSAAEGFKSDGYLFGDGVCHLASLINWAARDANLEVEAPTNHDFAAIPGVPRQYGVAIYNDPANLVADARENLYVTNNKLEPVKLMFDYDGRNLKVSIAQESYQSFGL